MSPHILTAAARSLLLTAILVLPALATELTVHNDNGVAYISGGAGDEERHALEAMSAQFNLKLTMAMRNGEFLGGAHVRILGPQGRTVIEVETDGPLFFAKLQPGTYTVTCNYKGNEKKDTVSTR